MAFSLDGELALLDLLPELLADVEELGAVPRQIVELLAPHAPPPGARALDLGCGKGTVSVALAAAYGWNVVGLDGMAAFVGDASERARRQGLAERCHFACGDVRVALATAPTGRFDVVLWLAVGMLLDDLGALVGALRRVVRPGGLIVIDEGFLEPPLGGAEPVHGEPTSREQAHRLLLSHGEVLLAERLATTEETRAQEATILAAITRRAQELARRHPERADAIERYLDAQRTEGERLATVCRGALWLLRRGA